MRSVIILLALARIAVADTPQEATLRQAVDDAEATGDDAQLRDAAEAYLSTFAGGPYAPTVMFKLGKRAHDRKNFDAAVKSLTAIVTKFPTDPNALAAGDLLLDSLAQARRLAALEATARLLQTTPAYHPPVQQVRLAQLIEQSIIAQADQLVADRADARAAEMYLRAADEFPKSPRVDEMLFNAGSMFQRAKDPFRAADLLRRSAEAAHGSLALRAMFAAAQLDAEWRPARAVDEYMRAAGMGCPAPQRGSACGEVKDSLYNAALLYFALGETQKAITAAGILAKADKANDEAAWLLAELPERAGDDARAAAAFETYAKTGRRMRWGFLHAGRAALRLGQIDRARKDFTDALSLSQGIAELAEARLAQGETFEREAALVKLDVPPKQVKTVIAKRTALIAQAAAIYTDVVNAKDPSFAIAAAVRTAHLYDDFATALISTPDPAGLSKDELRLYREQLDASSSGIKDRAIETYIVASNKAHEFAVVSAATIDAHTQLMRLAPEKFPREREARAPLRGEREYSPVIVLEARP